MLKMGLLLLVLMFSICGFSEDITVKSRPSYAFSSTCFIAILCVVVSLKA